MNEIPHSKNIVTASIYAESNLIVGDGNIIINLKEAAQYKAIEAEIQELNERFDKAKQKSIQYSDDPDFDVDLINIDSKRSQLQKDLETLKQEVIKLAEDFARIPINSERLKKAKGYFESGEFAEARAVLDAEVMGQELDALLEQKEILSIKTQENQQNLSDKANEYLILARLTSTDFELLDRFEKTVAHFEQSLRAERNGENIFGYAYFLQEYHQYIEATLLYEEALAIYRSLAQSNSEIFMPKVAMTLNNLGILSNQDNSKLDRAKCEFEEALSIYRSLAQNNPEIFMRRVAMTLNNLAALHHDKDELDQAQGKYEETLTIYRSLALSNSEIFLPGVAMALNNLAALHHDKNDLDRAEAKYEEALSIYQSLAFNKPETFLPDVAGVMNNLGLLYQNKNESGQAQARYEESLEIRRALAQSNPQIFLPAMAQTINNLAVLHRIKEDFEQAQSNFDEALAIYRSLAQNNPQFFLSKVSMIAANLAMLYQDNKPNREKSLSFAKECLKAGLPFRNALPSVENYVRAATKVIQKWGLDFDMFFEEHFSDIE